MTAHQKLVRDKMAAHVDAEEPLKRAAASSMSNAALRAIDLKSAAEVILKYEWLGNMGGAEYAYGLYFGEYLAGVACFGKTAGTAVNQLCGKEHENKVITLVRGACVHWAHPHSASFMINRACRAMTEHGKYVFVAYSDTDAGEIGTVYQASNWLFGGATVPTLHFYWPRAPHTGRKDRNIPLAFYDGRHWDQRHIHNRTRRLIKCAKGETSFQEAPLFAGANNWEPSEIKGTATYQYIQNLTRAEMKERLIAEGFVFEKQKAKFRYVNIVGDRRTVRLLRKALTWETLPYPKRDAGELQESAIGTTDRVAVRVRAPAPNFWTSTGPTHLHINQHGTLT